MDLIAEFKQSYERHFGEEPPKVWSKPSGGFTIVHKDGHRQQVSKRDLVLITALNKDMLETVTELNHG